MPRQIAVFGSFLTAPGSSEYLMAEELGYLLAQRGFEVLCGGHSGIADPLAAGVARDGGRVLGVSLAATRYPQRKARMNPLIVENVPVKSLAERLERFAAADGFIFFTGGIGTLSEFAFLWHTVQLDAAFDRPLVLLGRGWKRVLAQIRAVQMVKYKYYRMLHLCERAADAVGVVANDYTSKYSAAEQQCDKQAVLFDLDGALVESPEETFVRGCENFGRFFRMREVTKAFRTAGACPVTAEQARRFYSGLLERLGVEPQAIPEIAKAVSRGCEGIPVLYDDVVEALSYCRRQGLATGVVSSRPLPQLRNILAAHGLCAWIDRICPLPAMAGGAVSRGVVGALQAAGWSRRGTLYIGERLLQDDPADDLDAILLDRHLVHLDQDSAVAIRSLRELPFLLRRPASHGPQPPRPAK